MMNQGKLVLTHRIQPCTLLVSGGHSPVEILILLQICQVVVVKALKPKDFIGLGRNSQYLPQGRGEFHGAMM